VLIVIEALPEFFHLAIQRLLARMRKRRMPHIMHQRQRLHQWRSAFEQ